MTLRMSVDEIAAALVARGVPADQARAAAERDGAPGETIAGNRGTNPPIREPIARNPDTNPPIRGTTARRTRHATLAEVLARPHQPAPAEGATYVLEGRVVSGKNGTVPLVRVLGAICRACGHRPMKLGGMKKSEAAEAWQRGAVLQLRRQHGEALPFGGPVLVAITLLGPLEQRNAADGDNGQSAIWDALVVAGVLLDDRPAVLRDWRGRWSWAPEWGAVVSIHPTTGE